MRNFNPKEHVGLLIKFINGRVVTKINKNLADFNLTGVQHEILCFIDRNEHERDVFQKDIEKCLKLTNPTVTGIVKRLEEKEMIARYPSSTDARYKCLHVTEKGRDVICKSFKFGADNIEKQLVKDLSDDEVKMLKDLLYRVLKNMEE
ncbi:MarR family transcriptional regulator [Clostridium saudiense]|uniref:MarR family transcriptional regulator n=1 Tax=Clostridium saudiense TaxID=1414720 RepID=A0ABS2FF54_9CLOT|nr:MarR family transcriptional regulator [Clostridium saudiense]MBM6819064.1 MarR family transcriptional regulator [Clostridium saudiense]